MRTIPRDDRQMLTLARGCLAAWSANRAALGLSEAALAQIAERIAACEEDLRLIGVARAHWRGATTSLDAAARTLRARTASAVRAIRARALSTGDDSLYGLADIPAPRPRSFRGPTPGMPGDVAGRVNGDGSLTLTWKSNNPAGCASVVYRIRRAVGGAEEFTLIDSVGGRSFTDRTIPIGAPRVSYIISGTRGRETGPMSAVFEMRFGRAGGSADAGRAAAVLKMAA